VRPVKAIKFVTMESANDHRRAVALLLDPQKEDERALDVKAPDHRDRVDEVQEVQIRVVVHQEVAVEDAVELKR